MQTTLFKRQSDKKFAEISCTLDGMIHFAMTAASNDWKSIAIHFKNLFLSNKFIHHHQSRIWMNEWTWLEDLGGVRCAERLDLGLGAMMRFCFGRQNNRCTKWSLVNIWLFRYLIAPTLRSSKISNNVCVMIIRWNGLKMSIKQRDVFEFREFRHKFLGLIFETRKNGTT